MRHRRCLRRLRRRARRGARALRALRIMLHALVGGVAGDVEGAHRFYDARARVALRRVAKHLRVPWDAAARLEAALAAEMAAGGGAAV